MKEKTLSEKRRELFQDVAMHNDDINYLLHKVLEQDKQFIKEILKDIQWIETKDGFYVFDEYTEWLYRKIAKLIKKKAGFKELE